MDITQEMKDQEKIIELLKEIIQLLNLIQRNTFPGH
jgi:hypothetical protein